MGLDLWFRSDVARILQAAEEAMLTTAAATGMPTENQGDGSLFAVGYQRGFSAALHAVATAFGLNEPRAGYTIEAIREGR